jgi:hypothetical protein
LIQDVQVHAHAIPSGYHDRVIGYRYGGLRHDVIARFLNPNRQLKGAVALLQE